MQSDNKNLEPVKILWTGGWDSTFQLLRLVFLNKTAVEPHYLIDEHRPSTGTELLTMKRIRQSIRDIDEHAASLIRPTKYFSVSQIPDDPFITSAYYAIKSNLYIGSQYDWLARYCKYLCITNIQLCIHSEDKFAAVVRPILSRRELNEESVVLGSQYPETDESLVFKWFDFPILGLSKIDMANIAAQQRWSKIMEITWFCHSPVNGKSCGRCNPCRYTIAEGLTWRIQTHRRIIGKIHVAFLSPTKRFIKKILAKVRK